MLKPGEGNQGGDNVMIDNPIIDIRRTGSETENITEEFALQAK